MSGLKRYALVSEPKEDIDYVQLCFRQPLQTEKMPTPYTIRKSTRKAKDVKMALDRYIDSTKHKPILFYSHKEMPNIEDHFLSQKCFTLGLISVNENEEHHIINTELDSTSPPIISLYLCKDNKRDEYESYAGSWVALVNETKISQDFVPCDLDRTERTIVTVQSNSVYFFYTTCCACFKLEVKRRNLVACANGPSPDRVKEECIEVSSDEDPLPSNTHENSHQTFSPYPSYFTGHGRHLNGLEPQVEISYNHANYNSVQVENLKKELKRLKEENEQLRDKMGRATKAAQLILDIFKEGNM